MSTMPKPPPPQRNTPTGDVRKTPPAGKVGARKAPTKPIKDARPASSVKKGNRWKAPAADTKGSTPASLSLRSGKVISRSIPGNAKKEPARKEPLEKRIGGPLASGPGAKLQNSANSVAALLEGLEKSRLEPAEKILLQDFARGVYAELRTVIGDIGGMIREEVRLEVQRALKARPEKPQCNPSSSVASETPPSGGLSLKRPGTAVVCKIGFFVSGGEREKDMAPTDVVKHLETAVDLRKLGVKDGKIVLRRGKVGVIISPRDEGKVGKAVRDVGLEMSNLAFAGRKPRVVVYDVSLNTSRDYVEEAVKAACGSEARILFGYKSRKSRDGTRNKVLETQLHNGSERGETHDRCGVFEHGQQ